MKGLWIWLLSGVCCFGQWFYNADPFDQTGPGILGLTPASSFEQAWNSGGDRFNVVWCPAWEVGMDQYSYVGKWWNISQDGDGVWAWEVDGGDLGYHGGSGLSGASACLSALQGFAGGSPDYVGSFPSGSRSPGGGGMTNAPAGIFAVASSTLSMVDGLIWISLVVLGAAVVFGLVSRVKRAF